MKVQDIQKSGGWWVIPLTTIGGCIKDSVKMSRSGKDVGSPVPNAEERSFITDRSAVT